MLFLAVLNAENVETIVFVENSEAVVVIALNKSSYERNIEIIMRLVL